MDQEEEEEECYHICVTSIISIAIAARQNGVAAMENNGTMYTLLMCVTHLSARLVCVCVCVDHTPPSIIARYHQRV